MSEAPTAASLPDVCRKVATSGWFQTLTSAAIVGNAVTLGLATYPAKRESMGGTLELLDTVFIGFFVVELVIRIVAHGRNPGGFFRDGWNVFDFLVVTAAFIPGIRENITLLRLARLARVLRLIRVFPTLRIIVVAVGRSLPGALGLFAVAGVVLYLYGMVGWLMFADTYPEQFGTIGQAALTLFLLLTLEGLGDLVREGLVVSPWSLAYYVTFVLFGAFVLVNILIGVVLNSMEEARRMEAEEDEKAMPSDPVVDRLDALHATIVSMRQPEADRPCPEPCCVAVRSRERQAEHVGADHLMH
ncbi:ion transporter [Phytomonospora sp. NPDC050363]|uniref:ion transporter n=1 Tax=Phytomonospora sp. NPDC050363 TaxID=3155642 RepID=UPI0033E233ED